MADPTQIHQIAMNIITNAYHAVENVKEGPHPAHPLQFQILFATDPAASVPGCSIFRIHKSISAHLFFNNISQGIKIISSFNTKIIEMLEWFPTGIGWIMEIVATTEITVAAYPSLRF